MSKQELLEALTKRINRMYKRPSRSLYFARRRSMEWLLRSYNRWAAIEMVDYIRKSDKAVLVAAEEFRHMMDDFSTRNNEASRIFSIAYDVATDLMDYIEEVGV